jgi:hypothetical protein
MRRLTILLTLAGVFLVGCAKPPCYPRCVPDPDCPVSRCPDPK